MANKASLRSRVENLLERKPGTSRASSLMVMTILTLSAGAALALNLVRPDVSQSKLSLGELPSSPEQEEVSLRLSADPFPDE